MKEIGFDRKHQSLNDQINSLSTMALTVDALTLEAGDEPINEVERELLE